MNWRLKIAAKIVLSRLGVPYERWRQLGLFRLGRMDRPEYAQKIFRMHVQRAFPVGRLDGMRVIEIGPGDSIASAILARAHGAEQAFLIDAGMFASRQVSIYRTLADELKSSGLEAPCLSGAKTLEQILNGCRAHYLTEGVRSFASIADGSIDFIWSHSVLEHIPANELRLLMQEMRRVLKPGGYMSHNIDFQDHLAHGLNHLRFSSKCWEGPLFRNAGFYTNRVRATRMHALMSDEGFELVEQGFGRWPSVPIRRSALDMQFRDLDEAELLIRTSHVLARVPA